MLKLMKEDKWTIRTGRDEKETRRKVVDSKKKKRIRKITNELRRSLESIINYQTYKNENKSFYL
jgi:hypothetical protein